MAKSNKICKKDEGVAIMLEDGGGVGFENKLWDNVTKRSMKKGGNIESEWVAEFTNNNTGKLATKVIVIATSRAQALAKSCIKTGLKKGHTINVYEKMAKGGGVDKYSVIDIEDIKTKMYNWFTAWLGNFISDEELVNSLKRKLGTKWFRFFKNDTMASDWQSIKNSMKTKNNRDFLKENMQIALDEKSLEIYNSKGIKLAKGGSLESELPSDTEQLVKEGKVTYRGMGFGVSGVKIKVKGKEYIISDEKFMQLGGISKIKFGAPFRQFGKGTTIEGSEVSLHLPIEMSVYVPSTKDANIPVPKAELLKRVNEVKEYLANLFGGYSSSKIIGGYASNEGSLIQEDVVKVISFATKKAYEENKQKLINKIANWSTLWSQESIGFELEGDLYYINQDKKMGLGGALVLAGVGVLGYMAFIKKGKKENTSSQEYSVDIYDKGKLRNTMIVKEFQIEDVKADYKKLGYETRFIKLKKLNTGGEIGDEVYIEFLNKDKGFKEDVKHFKSYEEAVKWARENFDRFDPDMIKYKMAKGGNTDCGCWHYEIGGL